MDKIVGIFSQNQAENHVFSNLSASMTFEVKLQHLQNLHIYNVIIPTKI